MAALACWGLALAAWAAEAEEPIVKQLKGFAHPQEQPVTATLITEHASVQPGGQTRIGVLFEMGTGWHIYAQEPGDAGLPTRIAWSAPDLVTFGPLQWPAPEQFLDPGDIKTFGYAGAAVLFSTLHAATAERGHAPESIPIEAQVEWLACKDLCLPGSAKLRMSLPLTATPPVPSPHAELFAHAM